MNGKTVKEWALDQKRISYHTDFVNMLKLALSFYVINSFLT